MTVRMMKENINNKYKFKHLSLCVIASLAAQTAAIQYAFAQEQEEEIERISIIGSHIKRATDIATLPVTSMTAEDIANTAAVTGDDLIRSIPQMGSINFGETTGSANVNGARGDVGGVNLRGLGPSNTLVLLNGRRLVNHPGTQSAKFGGRVPVTTVNSNTLPVSGLRS